MKKISIIVFFTIASSFLTLCFAQSDIINTIAGNGRGVDSGDGGLAVKAALNWPEGVAVDKSNNIYIAEFNNNPRIRKISTSGIISTFVGNGIQGSSGDGGTATDAELNYPTGVCTDAQGDLYIADCENQVIRKMNIKTGVIHKIAGIYGCNCSGGDGGLATAAGLNFPMGVFVDKRGNIYIADHTNNKIRKIDTSQIITTIAGTGEQGLFGDGGLAIAAELYFPSSVCTDSIGNIYFTDTYNQRVRKVTISTGIISTVAGSGNGYSAAGYSGDGGPAISAELYFPQSLSIDKIGNIYIADDFNSRIRVVDATGVISTIVGDGSPGFSGDGDIATFAELNLPCGVALDSANNIYVVDGQNMRIRKINAVTTGIPNIKKVEHVTVFPNPSKGIFIITLQDVSDPARIEIYNVTGKSIYEARLNSINTQINISGQPEGIYLYRVITESGELLGEEKIIIQR